MQPQPQLAREPVLEGPPARADAKSKHRRGQSKKKHTKVVQPQATLSDLFGSSSEDEYGNAGADKLRAKDTNLFGSDSEDMNLFGDN